MPPSSHQPQKQGKRFPRAATPSPASASGLRIPPQNIEAEQALLGSIMVKPEGIHDALDIVSPDSFYAEKHRLIYQGMLDLFAKSEPIDLLSLSAKLNDLGRLESTGGRSYLAQLVNAVPTASNLKHYAEIVEKKAMMRGLIDAANDIGEMSYDESLEVETLLDASEKRIYEVTEGRSTRKFVSLRETLGEAWERIDNLHKNKGEMRGVPTGFKQLDSLLAGLQKSDLIILAARPSMGKTTFALDIARQTAVHHGTPVAIFSLEMSSQQLVDRMLASEARVNSWKLRTGNLSSEEEFDAIRDAMDRLAKAPIYMDDTASNNIMTMRSICRRLKREHGVGLIVVDYLQLMAPTVTRASDSMVQQVTEISRSLKAMAKELDVPVLALSQLSRAIETRRGKPRLSDLRDSGSIEQDADVAMFIHRDDKMNENSDRPNIAEILVEKHRNGPLGKVELYFDEKHTTFMALESSDFGSIGTAPSSGGDDIF